MADMKRFAYSVLMAASILVPAWGCSNEPSKPPPGAPQNKDGADFRPPKIEGVDEPSSPPADSAKDKKSVAPDSEKK